LLRRTRLRQARADQQTCQPAPFVWELSDRHIFNVDLELLISGQQK
jgi:hypothetical protein